MWIEQEQYDQMVETIELAKSFMTDVARFLKSHHPDLISEENEYLINKLILEDIWRNDVS